MVEAHKGQDRLAIVGRNHTVKLPAINPLKFLAWSFKLAKKRGIDAVFNDLRENDSEQYGSLRSLLLRGVHENKRERRLSAENPKVIASTKTIFGLVNIQPTLIAPDVSEDLVWTAFVDQFGGRTPILGHMLEDVNNLGTKNDGSVVFVDGGSRGLDRLLPQESDKIQTALGNIAIAAGQHVV